VATAADQTSFTSKEHAMATRIKSKTLAAVPQSKNDCAESIRLIGDLQREFERERAAMNDAISAITQQHQPALSDLAQRIEALQTGVQAWCEAHRVELCGEGDKLGKTANLVTGEVSWRQRPPSVSIRDQVGGFAQLVALATQLHAVCLAPCLYTCL
jgi:phage host-nuclease inhibitor protein Gam